MIGGGGRGNSVGKEKCGSPWKRVPRPGAVLRTGRRGENELLTPSGKGKKKKRKGGLPPSQRENPAASSREILCTFFPPHTSEPLPWSAEKKKKKKPRSRSVS